MAFLNILRFLYFYSFSLPLCYCLAHLSRLVFPFSFPHFPPCSTCAINFAIRPWTCELQLGGLERPVEERVASVYPVIILQLAQLSV